MYIIIYKYHGTIVFVVILQISVLNNLELIYSNLLYSNIYLIIYNYVNVSVLNLYVLCTCT